MKFLICCIVLLSFSLFPMGPMEQKAQDLNQEIRTQPFYVKLSPADKYEFDQQLESFSTAVIKVISLQKDLAEAQEKLPQKQKELTEWSSYWQSIPELFWPRAYKNLITELYEYSALLPIQCTSAEKDKDEKKKKLLDKIESLKNR